MGQIYDLSDTINPELKKYFEECFKDYKIRITKETYRDGIIRVFMIKDGYSKSILYNTEENKFASNIVDGVYPAMLPIGNAYTLHSYKIDDVIRSFVAISNIDNGVVHPIGYDANLKKLIEFPLNKDGLIDDSRMIENLSKEIPSFGVSEYLYKDILNYKNIYFILNKFNINEDVCEKLAKINEESIQELLAKTLARISKKYSGRMK